MVKINHRKHRDDGGVRRGWALFDFWVRRYCESSIWIDHEGTAIVDGQEVFVSERYLTLDNDFSCVEELAEKLGCELIIDDKSHHFPGKTIRLAILPN